jgi:Response regulator containing CheY-like receiver domain and AraC-type DNA-binding domain
MSEDKKIYKVLIIDDAFFIRNLIKRAIMTKPEDDKLGYKFDVIGEAINGKEGIIQYFNNKPDIITLDINMPDINGIEVAKQIISKDPNAKIIAISGNLDESITQEILKAGALEYIQKPFQNAYLWDKLDKVVDIIEGRSTKEEPIEVIEIVEEPEKIIEIITEIKEPIKPKKKDFSIPSPLDIFPKEEVVETTKPVGEVVEPTKTIEEEKTPILDTGASNNDTQPQEGNSLILAVGDDEDDDLLFTPKKKAEPIVKSDVVEAKREPEKTSPVVVEPVEKEVKDEPRQNKKPGYRKFPTTKVEEPVKEPVKEVDEEAKFKFSSEMEFDIEKELPIKNPQTLGSEDEELPIILPEDEATEHTTTLANENVTDKYDEGTIEIEIGNQVVQETTPVDDNVTQVVNNQTDIVEIAKQNENEEAIFIIDGNSGSDIEININPQSQPAEEDTDTLIIIEGTSENRETTNAHNEFTPVHEEIITKQEEVITIREEVAPIREEIISTHKEEATPVQSQSTVINEPTSLNKGTTPDSELNVDTHKYNTENNKVSSLNVEKESSSTKIAPPRSKVLKEIYSEKMLNEYKVEFDDDEEPNTSIQVEKKKDGLFSSIKKLFNKK